MLPNDRRLGAHLPLGSGMVRAADRAAAIGASALQVFSDNPTSWRRRPSLPRELPAFRARLSAHGIEPLAIHAPYLVNLAGPEPDLHERSVAVLANELRVATAYGARFVNVHIGSHRGEGIASGIDRLVAGVRQVFDLVDVGVAVEVGETVGAGVAVDGAGAAGAGVAVEVGVTVGAGGAVDGAGAAVGQNGAVGQEGPRPILLLENSAGSGFGLGVTIDQLVLIERSLAAAGIDRARFGFCLDTAHAWGAGYAIDTVAGVDAMLAELDLRLGLGRLGMVHLNDSRSELGSRSDRHEHIGAGRIGAVGLGRMLGHPGLGHVAYILETPGMESGYDAINVRRAWDSAAGRPLDDLPPEAFETRRPRAGSAPAETALAENANENKIDTRVAGTRGRRTDRPGRADR